MKKVAMLVIGVIFSVSSLLVAQDRDRDRDRDREPLDLNLINSEAVKLVKKTESFSRHLKALEIPQREVAELSDRLNGAASEVLRQVNSGNVESVRFAVRNLCSTFNSLKDSVATRINIKSASATLRLDWYGTRYHFKRVEFAADPGGDRDERDRDRR